MKKSAEYIEGLVGALQYKQWSKLRIRVI